MATEVTVKIQDSPLGQAFLIQQEEWDLCLFEIRGVLNAQEVETPLEYRFLSRNGNVVSPTLEKTITFREVAEEPFAEIKKEDSSLHSAEKRVVPQIIIIPTGKSSDNRSTLSQGETSCPFLRKFPCLGGFKDTLPCMRNVLNVQTLLKMAFLLTCLLFLMVFVLMLCLHMLFGISAVGGFAGTSPLFPYQHQQAAATADQNEALTSLKVKLSKMELASQFEIQDLKRKLSELEDLYLGDLERHRRELADMEDRQTALEKRYFKQVGDFSVSLDSMQQEMMRDRWANKQHYEQEMTNSGDTKASVETDVSEEDLPVQEDEENGANQNGDGDVPDEEAEMKKSLDRKKGEKNEKGDGDITEKEEMKSKNKKKGDKKEEKKKNKEGKKKDKKNNKRK